MDLRALLCESFERARKGAIDASRKKHIHTQRSELWVRELAAGFRAQFAGEPDVRVLSKYDRMNKREFGLNELLYDVCVCRVGACTSAMGRKQLCYVREGLWLVESEFECDSQQAIWDFNKLVLGVANNKLFIGPSGCREEYLKSLLPVARSCTGDAFVALMPHPSEWNANGDLNLFQLRGDSWADAPV